MDELQIANRALAVQPSSTSALIARTAQMRAAGRDVIAMGAGELDFDTPAHIKAAAKEAIDRGETKYTAVDGIPELKRAVVEKLGRENGLAYAQDEVIVTCGCKQALYNLTQAILNDGDEVVIPAPFWVSYPDMARLAGARPVILSAGIEQGYKIDAAQLRSALTDKTRLFIINSPSNPTGAHYAAEELTALGRVLADYPQILVVTDDIYEHMRWEGGPFHNIVNVCPELRDRCVLVNGVSKAYAMTGWRVGYAAGPGAVIRKMKAIQSQSTSNAAAVCQWAALAALDGDQSFIADVVATLRERHAFVYQALSRIHGIRARPCQGTFYTFPNVEGVMARLQIDSDIGFSEFLLEQAGVAIVPGSAFGAPGCVRLSYATSREHLERAMARIAQAVQ